jgi:hypothetical protein
VLMGEPAQGHVQRPTLAAADRAEVHGFAGLFLCGGRPGHQRRRLEWERISEGLSVPLLF